MDQFSKLINQDLQNQKPTWQENIALINTLLIPIQEIVLIFRNNPSFDTLSASLALYQAFKKIGRKAYLISPQSLDFKNLIPREVNPKLFKDINQIINFIPKKQLDITITYTSARW